jgi:hypothetical protein
MFATFRKKLTAAQGCYPKYREPTTNRLKPPTIMPKIPARLRRPIMPNKNEDANISRKNHSEFHHLASFAVKHTTKHGKPAIANAKL